MQLFRNLLQYRADLRKVKEAKVLFYYWKELAAPAGFDPPTDALCYQR